MRPKWPAAASISAAAWVSRVTSQGWDQNPVAVGGGQFVAGGGQPGFVLVAEYDLGAFFQAAAGSGAADAGAGRRGDHDDLPVQQLVAVHAGRGRPRARAAIMLRWISSDPP